MISSCVPIARHGEVERVGDGEPFDSLDDPRRGRRAVAGHDRGLHECVELERCCSMRGGGRLTDVRDGAVDAFGLPAGLVALAVVERAAEHRQADHVGVVCGVGQGGGAVHADQDREAILAGSHRLHVVEPVEAAGVGHRFAVEQRTQQLDRLRHSGLANRRRIERQPDRPVFRERMACADTELDATAAEVVNRRDLPSELHRMVKVVVEHERTDAYPRGRFGHRAEERERRPRAAHVIGRVHDVEAGRFGAAHFGPHRVGVFGSRDLISEAKCRHG